MRHRPSHARISHYNVWPFSLYRAQFVSESTQTFYGDNDKAWLRITWNTFSRVSLGFQIPHHPFAVPSTQRQPDQFLRKECSTPHLLCLSLRFLVLSPDSRTRNCHLVSALCMTPHHGPRGRDKDRSCWAGRHGGISERRFHLWKSCRDLRMFAVSVTLFSRCLGCLSSLFVDSRGSVGLYVDSTLRGL